jgi:aspartate carbamoyltransferase catalytic subunit
MDLLGKHLLSVDQFTSLEDLMVVCSLASELEVISSRKMSSRSLEGAALANLFFEPSTRTRISFGTAFHLLGGSVEETSGESASSLVKGESLYDTSRVISGYVDIIVMRSPQEGTVAEFAAASRVPVINGGDGTGEHPTQALLDLYTILKEKGRDGFKSICFVGDLKNGRTAHSLSKILSLFGITFIFVAPSALGMPRSIIALLKSRGNKVIETDALSEGVVNADVLYVTRIQEERFSSQEEFLRYAGSYAIDRVYYETSCKRGALLMHPLPRDSRLRNRELNEDLNDHPNFAVFRQSDHGIPIRMALFCLIFGLEREVLKSLKENKLYVKRKSPFSRC